MNFSKFLGTLFFTEHLWATASIKENNEVRNLFVLVNET